MLVVALKKAQKESQEAPFGSPDLSPEGFIERAKKRIEQFDLERAAVRRGWQKSAHNKLRSQVR